MNTLRTITECLLCDKQFDVPVLPVPDIGQPVNEQTLKVVQAFAKHLEKKHPERLAFAQTLSMGVMGVEILKNFQHADAGLLSGLEQTRIALYQMNQRREINDATLLDRIARLELGSEDATKVFDLARQLRDFLTEVDLRPKLSAIVAPNGQPVVQP